MLEMLLLLLSLCRPARILRWGIFLAGMFVLWLVVERPILHDYINARARRNSWAEQVQRLQRQQQQYQAELADLKRGGFRLEKTIREQLPLIRPGEQVIYIETPADRKAAAEQAPALEVQKADESAPEPVGVPKAAKARPVETGEEAVEKPLQPEKSEKSEKKPTVKKTARKTSGKTSGKAAGKTAVRKSGTPSRRTKKKASTPAAND